MDKKLTHRKTVIIERAFAALIATLFFVIGWGLFRRPVERWFGAYFEREAFATEPIDVLPIGVSACAAGEIPIRLADGLICRNDVPESAWRTIYDTYPLSPNGKEAIFSFLNTGDLAVADLYLNDFHSVPRYDPVRIAPMTWTEDPYNQKYWRFIFYGLRSTEDLLYAWQTTGNPAYKDKFLEITDSFLSEGTNAPHAWDDNHTVAFRTMVLVNAWWRLREHGALSVEMSTKLLESLKQHGDFLANREHFESQYNHGLNESAALFLLAFDFPDMPGAEAWKKIAEERIDSSFDDAVDADGVLVENSPFYHYYSMEKYWEILRFMEQQGAPVSPNARDKIERMISYAANVLQPDGNVPLLGASLKMELHDAGIMAEIASTHPELRYALTGGKKGKKPASTNKSYLAAGETIMRSGWGTPETYKDQTQIIYDIGAYRTDHSDLDALSFSLYGRGGSLMPDSGLYTYENGALRSYFKGTSAHNTVVVDGADQARGFATPGFFVEGKGYAYQSAQHRLYRGVSHERAIALLGDRLVLVVDRLRSDEEHTYDQMFHLFSGATTSRDGVDIRGYADPESERQVSIHQLITDGMTADTAVNQTNPPKGICSEEYEKLIPCPLIDYRVKAANADFVTLIEIGKPDPSLRAVLSSDRTRIVIGDRGTSYAIDLASTQGSDRVITVDRENPPASQAYASPVAGFFDPPAWTKRSENGDGSGSLAFPKAENAPSISLASPSNGTWVEAERPLALDLSKKNIVFRVKVDRAENLKTLELGFSNGNWQSSATELLTNPYRPEYSGEWLNITLGKGMARDRGGQWNIRGTGFNWGAVDRIRIRIRSVLGKTSTISMDAFGLLPEQSEGRVILTFDDGYASVLSAAELLRANGLKANVAVISGNVDNKKSSYLSLRELKQLQDEYGWNIVNHSWLHKDAVVEYASQNDLAGLEEDVLKGLEYLQKNGINSDQNWYVAPHGEVSPAIKDVIGKYYKFLRTTQNAPEAYPFGDPLSVKTLSVGDDVSPDSVIKAIEDAKTFKLTLFLTFHRIRTEKDGAGYPVESFRKIAECLAKGEVPTMTFRELDEANGVAVNALSIADARPEQIALAVARQTPVEQFIDRLKGFLSFGKSQ